MIQFKDQIIRVDQLGASLAESIAITDEFTWKSLVCTILYFILYFIILYYILW